MIKYGHSFAVKAALTLITLAVAACAATKSDQLLEEPRLQGPALKKLLVVGVSNQAVVRRTFEDGFVEQIKAAGVDAVASYTVMPEDGQATGPAHASRPTGRRRRTLITRLVRVDVATQYSPAFYPPMGMGYYGGYSGAWAGYYNPGVMTQTDTVVLETSLFGINESKLLWSGTTQTFAPSGIKENMPGFAKTIIGALKKESH